MKITLPLAWKVPQQFRARLGETVGRQRAMFADGHLLLVVHEPPSPADQQPRGRLFWRDAAGGWKSTAQGSGVQSLRTHVGEFTDGIQKLDDELERAISADDYFRILQAIAPLHRAARNLHATLQQAREMVPDDRDVLLLRDQAADAERAADLLHGDAKNGLDFTVARGAEEQAQRSYEMAISAHRLNLLAAIFFPIATLGAIFGMNLSHGLEGRFGPLFFWVVLAAGLTCGLLLIAAIARKPGPQRPPAESPHDDRRPRH